MENEMPALFTVTGTTSVLASDVTVEIHNRVQPLTQIVNIIGEAASKKSSMDEIFEESSHTNCLKRNGESLRRKRSGARKLSATAMPRSRRTNLGFL